jgi:transmembrane sensor
MLTAGVNPPALRIPYCTHMKITDTLIQKFLESQCTAAEAEAVARHLKKHPELMAMYLQPSWDAADKENGVPAGYAEEMRKAINAQIGKQARIIRFRWLAAVASLMIVATAIWLFTPAAKTPAQTLVKVETQPALSPAKWKELANTSAKAWSIKLEDGSVVKLAPKAVIKYQGPFGQQGQRNIYLQGEADFEVTHNKNKPFTVHTKLFSTMALGTSFRVSETATACNVKLFHGKVLIKSLMNTLKGWKQDIILLPGNEMKYSLEKGAVAVNQFNTAPKQHSQPRNNEYSNKDEGTMVFDNTPLPDVIKTLTTRYHAPIFYDEEQLKGKYFSGEVLKGDSLSVLLNVIANMNGLQVTKKEDGFIITQSK